MKLLEVRSKEEYILIIEELFDNPEAKLALKELAFAYFRDEKLIPL